MQEPESIDHRGNYNKITLTADTSVIHAVCLREILIYLSLSSRLRSVLAVGCPEVLRLAYGLQILYSTQWFIQTATVRQLVPFAKMCSSPSWNASHLCTVLKLSFKPPYDTRKPQCPTKWERGHTGYEKYLSNGW